MQPVVRKFKTHADADAADREFYRSLTPQQRLDLMLEIVAEGNRDPDPRMQKVVKIVRCERS